MSWHTGLHCDLLLGLISECSTVEEMLNRGGAAVEETPDASTCIEDIRDTFNAAEDHIATQMRKLRHQLKMVKEARVEVLANAQNFAELGEQIGVAMQRRDYLAQVPVECGPAN